MFFFILASNWPVKTGRIATLPVIFFLNKFLTVTVIVLFGREICMGIKLIRWLGYVPSVPWDKVINRGMRDFAVFPLTECLLVIRYLERIKVSILPFFGAVRMLPADWSIFCRPDRYRFTRLRNFLYSDAPASRSTVRHGPEGTHGSFCSHVFNSFFFTSRQN